MPGIDMKMTIPPQTSGCSTQYPRRLSPYELLVQHEPRQGRFEAQRCAGTSPSPKGEKRCPESLVWIGLALILIGLLCFVCNTAAIVHSRRRNGVYEDNWAVETGFGVWNFVVSTTAGGVAIACGRSPGRRTVLVTPGMFVLASCVSACGVALAAVAVHIELTNKTDKQKHAENFNPNILALASLLVVSHTMSFICNLFGTKQSVLRLQLDHVPRAAGVSGVQYISPPIIPISVHSPREQSDLYSYSDQSVDQIYRTETACVRSACDESEILENSTNTMDILETEALDILERDAQMNLIPGPVERPVAFEYCQIHAQIPTHKVPDESSNSQRTIPVMDQNDTQTNQNIVLETISYLSLIFVALLFKILSVVKPKDKKSYQSRYRLLSDF